MTSQSVSNKEPSYDSQLTEVETYYPCMSICMCKLEHVTHVGLCLVYSIYIASFRGEQNNILYMSYFHTYYNPLTLKPIVKANLRENISCNEFLIP